MLSIIVGPMYSKKTSWLMDNLSNHLILENNVIYINSILDTRDKLNKISTHNRLLKIDNINFKCVKAKNLNDIDINEYDVIGIDEAQWFNDLYETVKYWLSLNKIIYCVGLDGDFKMQIIGDIYKLLPLSNYFKKKNAICSICAKKKFNNKPASFTKYLGEGNISDTNYIIDNGSNYIPVCRLHH